MSDCATTAFVVAPTECIASGLATSRSCPPAPRYSFAERNRRFGTTARCANDMGIAPVVFGFDAGCARAFTRRCSSRSSFPRSESRASSGQQMRRRHRQFAGGCGAANVASGGGTPDLGAPVRAAPKSGVGALRDKGTRWNSQKDLRCRTHASGRGQPTTATS